MSQFKIYKNILFIKPYICCRMACTIIKLKFDWTRLVWMPLKIKEYTDLMNKFSNIWYKIYNESTKRPLYGIAKIIEEVMCASGWYIPY